MAVCLRRLICSDKNPGMQAATTLHSLIASRAVAAPTATALLNTRGEAIGYGDLHARVQGLAQELTRRGANSASRIAVVLPNGPEMALAFLAAACCGASAPLNPAFKAAEFEYYLADLGARFVLVSRGQATAVRAVAAARGLEVVEVDPLFLPLPLPAPHAQTWAASESGPAPGLGDVALVLHTSGTTGRPKTVPLTHANLLASALSIAAHLHLAPADRCLNVMPLFHIHGLVGALLSTLASGGSLVCTPGFDEQRFFGWVGAMQPTWYTAVPTIHQGVLAAGERYAREAPGHRFRFVRSSSAALAPRTLAALEALTGAPVIEAYGMTEASHQMASNPLPPGTRKPGSVGRSAGAATAIMDATGRQLAAGNEGEVVIRGAGVTAGYEDNALANAHAFADGWFRTGDLGRLDNEGYLTLTGRLKEMVNRGGEKIAPREVDEALLDHDTVAQAVAFGVPHPTLGEDLAAAVVVGPGAVFDEAALRRHLFARLAAHKVPTQIVCVDEIPKGATGKVQRAVLHERLAPLLRAAFEAPRGASEQAVAAAFAGTLARQPVGRQDNFFALGGDSLKAAVAASALEKELVAPLQAVDLFHHPTVAALAAHADALRDAAPDLVDAKAPSRAVPATTDATMPAAMPGAASLSYSQEALWFVEQLLGHSGAYNSHHCVELVGVPDEAALQRALLELVARHEALRTGVAAHAGRPVAQVAPAGEVALERLAARGVHPEDRLRDAERLALTFVEAPFVLERPPLVRAALVALEPNRHWLVLALHHLVTDGSSMVILARELSQLYAAQLAGREPALAPVPLQYPHFAARQRQCLQGPHLESLLAFWRHTLAGIEPLALPTDRPRPRLPSYAGRTMSFTLPPGCTTGLRALARRESVTPFMVLLAAFQVLLARHARTDDVAVGTPVAGRSSTESFAAVGYFVNSLVLRTNLSGNPTFRELLARVRATVLAAFEHEELPFDRLVSELNPHRDLGRNPLVQISFALNSQPPVALALPGLEVSPVELPVSTSKFDLALAFVELDGEYCGTIEYATALFDAGTVDGLAQRYGVLLQAAIDAPETPIARLPLLDAAARHRLITNAAGPQPREGGEAESLPHLIATQAALNPTACAVADGRSNTSYGSLMTAAEQIACALVRLGVARGDSVVLCTERSAGLVAAVLGILRAGALYVPVDPGTPPERARFVCADADARVVITEPALRHLFAGTPATVLTLARDGALAGGPAGTAVLPEVEPDDLAYMIYTSGSTGRPKGVEVSHASACNHARWFAATVGAQTSDRFLFKTSIGFDAALVELFVPLSIGATIVVAEANAELDPERVVHTLVHERATVMQAVPSALHLLLAEPALAQVRTLRFLVCGGEALHWALVREVRERLPGVRLGNFYGPTETCIDATCYPIDERAEGEGPVPIGRPIAGLRAHVLDGQLEPLPHGVVGELYVGGIGLARGYRNQPEQTRRAFVSDPFLPGERLYATGDLVHRRADGELVYVGRANDQIKLRGFRIELGEIESALRREPEVAQCAVLPFEPRAGDTRLAAYVVRSNPTVDLDGAALRQRLAAFLPEYMLPAAWMALERLPLTASGKIDRASLPVPNSALANEARVIEPPRGAVEAALAELWCELLGVARVGRDDDFFALGGHSVLAVALVDAMRRRAMGVDVLTVFQAPTLAALAAAVEAPTLAEATGPQAPGGVPPGSARVEPGMLPLVALTQAQIDNLVAKLPGGAANLQDVLPLAPLHVGILWRHMLESGPDGYVGRWVLSFDAAGHRARFLRALQQIIGRHDPLRTSLHWEGLDAPVQVVHRHASLAALEVAAEAGQDALVGLLSASDPERHAMSLHSAPLMAAWTADDPGHGRWLLALNHHDAAFDHASQDIVLDELRQLLASPAAPLPAAPQSRSWLARTHREGFAPHAPYFRALLGDVEEPTLPFGRTDVDRHSHSLRCHRSLLDTRLQQSVRLAAAKASTTVAVFMHAAWGCVVGACSGRDDVVFGTVLNGRSRRMPGMDRMVGLFINTLPVRLRLAGTSVSALLSETRRQLVELMAHEAAALVDAQRCSAVPAGNPHFGALLNYRQGRADWAATDAIGESRGDTGLEVLPGIQRLHNDSATHYPFGLTVDDLGERLVITTHAPSDVDAARLSAFLSTALAQLARAALEAPEQPVTAWSVLHEQEHEQLARYAAGPQLESAASCVHRLIEARAAQQPEAFALEDAGRAWRYGELEAQSNRIARVLRGRGVGAGARVGLCLERGAGLVAALLGALKAGAAYVPLDPAYPKERLQYTAADAQLAALVVESAQASPFDWPRERTLVLDADAALIDAQAATPLPDDERSAGPTDPAYVIYTSGSTGKPKGVVVPHGAVVNFLSSMAREPGLACGDRLLAVTTPSFDIAVLELLLPLAVGATVVVAHRSQVSDGAALRLRLQASGANVMQATPATWRLLIDAGWHGGRGFKALVGGEALAPELAAALLERCGELWNMYGPTETTVWSTCGRVQGPQEGVTIGRPIANTTVRVLDGANRLCPIGVAGEICIGGAGVALGYLNRPELTAERFVSDPHAGTAQARLYRTGDLGRWRSDGELEHLGRIDQQIKLRGYRIEPGEIESALLLHAAVSEAVVVARQVNASDVRLVAYVRFGEHEAVPAATLWAHLRTTLPEYMVPSHLVAVQAMPLTPSGKVDRKALPEPFAEHRTDAGPPPKLLRGANESLLAAVWAELLGHDDIGPDDNFFDLGGHSLLVMQAVARMESRSGVTFSPKEVMFGTLAELASRLGGPPPSLKA